MPIDIPTNAEVINRSKTDVQRQVEGGIDPFNKNNVVTAITVANANRVFDFYLQLQAALLESLPDTAVEFLDRWAAIYGITRLAATAASGNIAVTGVLGTNVPLNTIFVASDAQTYTSNLSINIVADSIATVAVNRLTNIATVETVSAHGLSNNSNVTSITGITPSSFNAVSPVITVTGPTTFTYENTGIDEPATVQGTVNFEQASVPVDADDDGETGNQDFNTPMSLQAPIVDVDTEAGVDGDGITGGTDQESDENLRTRLLERIQNPVSHFNAADIETTLKEINGITRVFVFGNTDSTDIPSAGSDAGYVTIFFMRDNDDVAIPDAGEVTTAQTQLNTILPANTGDETDLVNPNAVVLAPTAVPTAFTLDALNPNTLTMQAAVTANLEAYFAEKTTVDGATLVDGDVPKVAYDATIFNTVDPDTGDIVISFNVLTPAGDISIAPGEIATFLSATYPAIP